MAKDGESFVSTFIVVGDVDFIVVIEADVDDNDGSVFIINVVIVDNTVGSVIDGVVVIVVGDVNDIVVGVVLDFIVVIVVVDCTVVVVSVVVFLLSFLLL